MIQRAPQRRHKPHKKIINKMKDDYFAARSEARRKDFTKQQEIDLSYLQDEIERRWFRFFADHYIEEPLATYCSIITNAPNRGA